ncbi:MAG: DUF1549 and DUF1553 domain-containing protein [Planctomycetaceae bacterium]
MSSMTCPKLPYTRQLLLLASVIMFQLLAAATEVRAAVNVFIGPSDADQGITLRGPDSRQQVFVTAELEDGRTDDLTHTATYTAEPAGIVEVSSDGLVKPLSDGIATLRAVGKDGETAEIAVTVTDYAGNQAINFKNQVVPIFTKLTCNSGGCHGKSGGQNGFRLSLLGFYPDDDYEFLVKEGRGRRLFPPAPSESLLLKKATGEMPHGGGARLERESHEYRLIERWISQGMPYGNPDDPVVTKIECLPAKRIMDREDQQQITVQATYSDGTTEDVTRMALFEANDTELAEASLTGLVNTTSLAGEVAVMARYQGQVSTFRATVPLGEEVDNLPPANTLVDDAVFSKLKELGIPPSELCDDATFLRRVSIDITGTLPTAEEAEAFLADPSPDKRDRLIDELLDSPEYADYFATKWNAVLRNKKRQNEDLSGTYAFHQWIWQSLYENKPYDQFVREIVTATGDARFNPPVVWYREVGEINEQVEDTAQLFLGVRIQCARCHHHPFEKWSQNDYYSMAAFFSRIGKKPLPVGTGISTATRDQRLFHNDGVATQNNPRSGKSLVPAGLGGPALDIPASEDPRAYLADWMSEPDNAFFAKSLVNRYWKHFTGRGIVEPEDDMRETNPPSNPELLDGLAQSFVESGFDLKQLVRTICRSSTYQLSALPNEYNLSDRQNFSRYYPKRLTAEALFDAFHQVTDVPPKIGSLPQGMGATEMADMSIAPYFLKVFGQPQADTACECERSMDANLAQSLHLLNSSEVQNTIANANGRAAALAKDTTRTKEEKVTELYHWVFSRDPQPDELQIAIAHIDKHAETPQPAYEDLLWALINTKEFLFNH